MRLSYIAFPLMLAACASPQERCIADTNRELNVINRLINETRGNVARGFAIEEQEELVVVNGTCEGETSEGVTFEFDCEKTETVSRRVPVAIDLNAERAKLDSLEERQQLLRSQQAAKIAQCQAQFPES